MLCNFHERAIGGAAARFDKTARGGAHFLGSLGSRKNSIRRRRHLRGSRLARRRLPRRSEKAISAKFSIEGPNTESSEGRGLKNIVPPDGTSEPPTKHAIGNAIERGEFADAIHQNDRNIFRIAPFSKPPAGCPGPGIGSFERRMNLRCDSSMNSAVASNVPAFAGRGPEVLWDIRLAKFRSDEREGFFRGDNAARDDDWGTTATPGFYLEPIREGVGAGSSKSYFKLPLTKNAVRRRPRARMRSASFSLCIRKPLALRKSIFQKRP